VTLSVQGFCLRGGRWRLISFIHVVIGIKIRLCCLRRPSYPGQQLQDCCQKVQAHELAHKGSNRYRPAPQKCEYGGESLPKQVEKFVIRSLQQRKKKALLKSGTVSPF